MIFAHAPASFLLCYFFKKHWQKNFSRRNISWLFFLSLFGGIFPDIDLIYYYLSSASFSHHEIFTHSLLFYIIICGTVFFIGWLLKKRIVCYSSVIFFASILTHFIVDSIGGGIVWLYPFSKSLFGMDSFSWYRNSVLGKNFFIINYTLESIIYFGLFILIISKYIKTKIKRIILSCSLIILLLLFLFLLFFVSRHLFHNNSEMYYNDADQDKIINKYDLDIDNDDILNINDPDIDNNGIDNSQAMYNETFSLKTTWYDPTEGGLIEIPLRLGLVTNADFIERIFANVGIFIRTEMENDYKINSEGYVNTPKINTFERTVGNWQAFLRHKNKLLDSDDYGWIQEYDILFFNNDYVALALWYENDELILMEASPNEQEVIKTTLTEIRQRKGPVLQVGRLLPKPAEKKY